MGNLETTFLTEQQIWGDEKGDGQLQIMQDHGTKTIISDLAVLQGGLTGRISSSDPHAAAGVWTASSTQSDLFTDIVDENGRKTFLVPTLSVLSARPALPASVASSIDPNEIKYHREISGVSVIAYGEYPQTVALERISRELETLYSEEQLQTTGKKYTFRNDNNQKIYSPKEHVEYQHDNRHYIRVEAHPHYGDTTIGPILSNGHSPEEGKAYWVQVEPIEWLVDPSGIMLAKHALFSGITFNSGEYYNGDFENTDIKQYLDTYFSKEITAQRAVGVSEAIGPNTAAVISRREAQQSLDDPSLGRGHKK